MRVVVEPFPEVISAASAVTIGKFDGVHLGHLAVLGELRQRAQALGVESVVVTFDRNPLEVIRPENCPPALVSLDRKLELLAAAGLDCTVVLRFDSVRAGQPAEAFVRELLVGRLGARSVAIGADFRFGARGIGNAQLLMEMGSQLGFETVVIADVGTSGDARVSATAIRALVAAGRVREAAGLLGRPPSVVGEVVHGEARGRELGFPTANMAQDSIGPRPAEGVYAGYVSYAGMRFPAAISVSDNPTFGGDGMVKVEAHLIDADLDLYGQTIEVEFWDRVRGIEKFDSADALVRQMRADVVKAMELLATPAPGIVS